MAVLEPKGVRKLTGRLNCALKALLGDYSQELCPEFGDAVNRISSRGI